MMRDPVAAALFGRVHGLVGVLEDLVGSDAKLGDGQAHAGTQIDDGRADSKRLGDSRHDSICEAFQIRLFPSFSDVTSLALGADTAAAGSFVLVFFFFVVIPASTLYRSITRAAHLTSVLFL